MTVSYQNEVASSTSGGFTRLLLKWRGSLYKLLYRELALFCGAYAAIFVLYSFILTDEQKRIFDMLRNYCNYFINLLPLSFVLGFYVSFVADRWWQQYTAIPWPDKILHSIALYVQGADDHSRMMRRTMVRYLNLSLVLLLRSISSAVKRRLPTLDHLVESGFMTAAELEEFSSVPRKEFNTYWIPCCWFMSLLREARSTNHVVDSQGLKLIVETFNEFRANCGLLWSYDWVSIPLVYTQVVTIATYTFFVACLVGRQQEAVYAQRTPDGAGVDFYIPLFTILQFLFYMGLLKVAEQLINPFGDDDEDFELNWIIDRHVKVSYLIVDSLNIRRPPLTRDMYFDDPGMVLPYTEASVQYKIPTYRGSVHSMKVPEKQHTLVMPEIKEESNESEEEEDDENIFGSTSLNSIPENGPVDGHDPRVGAMSVPDEALLSGNGRNSATSAASKTRLTRLSDSAGSCGSNRRLDIAGVEAAPQTDPAALSRPRLEPQLSTVTNGSTGDESSSPRRNSLAPGGNENIIRRESMSAPNRSQPRLPKRSSSWQSPSIIPPRWRRRKKTEVIWHPYVPPTASEQSLADSGSPDVTCLVSPEGNAWPNHDDDCERGNGRARMPDCYRRSVPSVFVQAPSIRVRVPAGAARSRQSWAGGPGISRSLDERRAAPLSPSTHSPTASEPPLCPSRSSPTERDVFASARQLTGVTEDDEPHTGDDVKGQGPIMFSAPDPLSFPTVAGSLPDIQQGASASASSTLERKHSLPASAHKRVQIVAPSEVERILAAPRKPVPGRYSPVPPSSTPATSVQPAMGRYSSVPPSSSTPETSIQPAVSTYSPVPPSSSTPATSVLTPPTSRSSANTEEPARPPAPNGRTARETTRDTRKQAQRKRP